MDLYPQKFSYSAKSSNVLFHLRDSKMHKPQEKKCGKPYLSSSWKYWSLLLEKNRLKAILYHYP